MEQVKLWVTNDDGSVRPLPIRDRIEYEDILEDMLSASPDMLGDDLTLIGRQLMTASGPLDLLGIDGDGKLVVYELKRGLTPREALTQAIDYASWLDSLEFDELTRRISEHQPVGIDREFDTFDDWYADQFDEDQAQQLRPTRMVVVGLGIEPAAERMAHWLADKGVDIEALTFHVFENDGRTVLARQLEVSSEAVEPRRGRSAPPRPDPLRRAAEFQAVEVYQAAYQLLASCFSNTPHRVATFKNGVNFTLPPTDDRRIKRYPGYIGPFVRTDVTGEINVFIRPAAVQACPDELGDLLKDVKLSATRAALQKGDTEAFISVDAQGLARIAPQLRKFTEAAIAAWQRDWDHLNADAPDPEGNDP